MSYTHNAAFARLASKEIKLRSKSLKNCFAIDADDEIVTLHIPLYGGMSCTCTFQDYNGKVLDIFFVNEKNFATKRLQGQYVDAFIAKLTQLYKNL